MSPGRKRVEMRIVTHSQQLSQLTRGPHAGLPGRVQVAINALYALMNRCKVEAERARGGAEQAARWRRRQEMVLYTLLTHHLQASALRE